MPVPIKMGDEVINKQEALWKKSPSDLKDEDYLDLYRYLYPFEEEPLLWVHLKTDYPFVVNGILYFPKLKPDVELNKGQIKLFCNQVFVSDNCEEVIPKFLTPLRGVIDSTDIPLNVSRSFLQADRTVKRIADYVAKKVGDRLKELYRDDLSEYVPHLARPRHLRQIRLTQRRKIQKASPKLRNLSAPPQILPEQTSLKWL